MTFREHAWCAEGSSRPTDTARRRHARERVLRVDQLQQSAQDVFDLTVDGAHEFFANGILVHNSCDAARYLCDVLAEPTGSWSAQDVKLAQAASKPVATDDDDDLGWSDLEIDMAERTV